jgi:hypothetical protein
MCILLVAGATLTMKKNKFNFLSCEENKAICFQQLGQEEENNALLHCVGLWIKTL